MSDEEKKCARPGCDRKLRSDNKKGVCADRSKCLSTESGPTESSAEAPPKAKTRKKTVGGDDADIDIRFSELTHGLGFDADELVLGFKREWIAGVKRAVENGDRTEDARPGRDL